MNDYENKRNNEVNKRMDKKPLYLKDVIVQLKGSEDIIWKVEEFIEDSEHGYIYKLLKIEGDIELERLNWCPQGLLKKV
jgi:hypothetical protein